MIKIKNWEELHKTEQKEKGEEFIIEVLEVSSNISQICIQKRECNNLNMLTRIYSDQPTEKILSVLKCYGFDIEFQEEPTLTDREWHWLMYFSDGRKVSMYRVERRAKPSNVIINGEEISYTLELFPWLKAGMYTSVEDLLKLKRKST
jgi:hypothetical protein